MNNYIFRFLILFLFLFPFSCQKQLNEFNRQEFIELYKNNLKNAVINTSSENKAILWRSKLLQVRKEMEAKQDYVRFIDEMISYITPQLFNNLNAFEDDRFALLVKEIISNTPEIELYKIWTTVEDYKFNESYWESYNICSSCLEEILNPIPNVNKQLHNREICNCRWWCPVVVGDDCSETGCTPQGLGCGFLGLQSCTKRCVPPKDEIGG